MILRKQLTKIPIDYEQVVGPSLTIPDCHLEITQLLKLVMAGQPLPACGLDVYYDKEPSFDNLTILDRKGLDLTDIQRAKNELLAEKRAMFNSISQWQKFKEKQASNASETPQTEPNT